MKDRPDCAARLQLIESMFAGQSWRAAAAESQLKISRSTAYRLVQLAPHCEQAGRENPGLPRIGGVTRCSWTSLVSNHTSGRSTFDHGLTADAPLL